MANVERSVVGDLINFRGMVYAPQSDNGVALLFGKVADDLNMYIEEIRPEGPDAVVRRFTGGGWERLRTVFAFRTSQLRQRTDAENCDLVVCWEHDWQDCPLDVVELRDRIREMENWPIHRPDEPVEGGEVIYLDDWFAERHVTEAVRDLFHALAEHVRSLDEMAFYRVGRDVISFHSPQRAFIHVYPRPNALRVVLFTRGESLGEVQPLGRKSSKWGVVVVSNQDQLLEAFPWIEESYKRMNAAIGRNEQTTWRATRDEVVEEEVEA